MRYKHNCIQRETYTFNVFTISNTMVPLGDRLVNELLKNRKPQEILQHKLKRQLKIYSRKKENLFLKL